MRRRSAISASPGVFLEATVDAFVGEIIGVQDNNVKSAIPAALMKMPPKLKLLKVLGGFRRPSPEWLERLCSVIAKIDNELREERNRCIHDVWLSGSGDVTRWRRMTKLVRMRSKGPLMPVLSKKLPITEDEIWDFVQKIQSASVELSELMFAYVKERPPWFSESEMARYMATIMSSSGPQDSAFGGK